MRKWKVGDKAKVTLPDGSRHTGEIVRKSPDGTFCVLEINKDLEILTEVEFSCPKITRCHLDKM